MATPTAVWLRLDLRVHDHEPLIQAAEDGPLHVVYCLDPRQFETTDQRGFARTGWFRARFLLESLADLRGSLRALGSELIVLRGRPEVRLPEWAERQGWTSLHYHRLVGTEEEQVEQDLAQALMGTECSLVPSWDRTLVDPDELPFGISEVPEVFTAFRKHVERLGGYPGPLPAPTSLPGPGDLPEGAGELPCLEELGLEEVEDDPRGAVRFEGGETAGKARLQAYFWEADRLRRYKETRNGMVGPDYSSKFSPWLAHGCLSARWIQAEVERYESERVKNRSTYWLTFELLWRDYFQLITAKHGAHLFRPSGLQGIPIPWNHHEREFERWRLGETGYPIVDANMRELLATGFQSNRGRQIVASFLTKNLGIDWRWGAEWFESQLVDYDVASNYGNWNYTAGVGNDARGFRYFHLPTQADKYDRSGQHAVLWCPELRVLPRHLIHNPGGITQAQSEQLPFHLGRDYPRPVVDLDQSVQRNRDVWEQAVR